MANKSGFILIIVIGLLAALAAVAITLTGVARVSDSIAQQGLLTTRARLNARSGLAKVITNFSLSREFGMWRDMGADHDRDGSIDPMELELAPDSGLLEDSLSPSYPVMNGTTPELFVIAGQQRGLTTGPDTGESQVRLVPVSSMIDLNAGIDGGRISGAAFETIYDHRYSATSADHPFNAPLVRILNALGDYFKYTNEGVDDNTYDWQAPFDRAYAGQLFHPSIACNADGDPETPPTHIANQIHPGNQLGRRLLSLRPEGGFSERDWPAIESAINTWGHELASDGKLFSRLEGLLTLHPERRTDTVIVPPPLPYGKTDIEPAPASNADRLQTLLNWADAERELIESNPPIGLGTILSSRVVWVKNGAILPGGDLTEGDLPDPTQTIDQGSFHAVTVLEIDIFGTIYWCPGFHGDLDSLLNSIPDQGWLDYTRFCPEILAVGTQSPLHPDAVSSDGVFHPERPDRFFHASQNIAVDRINVSRRDHRSFIVPRAVIDINTAPEAVVAAVIHAVGDVNMRVGSTGYLNYHVNTYDFPLAGDVFHTRYHGRLYENGHPPEAVFGPDFDVPLMGRYFSRTPDLNLFSMTESIRLARDLIAVRDSAGGFELPHVDFYNALESWPRGWDARNAWPGSSQEPIDMGSFSFYKLGFWWLDNFRRQRVLWHVLGDDFRARSLLNESALIDIYAPEGSGRVQTNWRNPLGFSGAIEFDSLMKHQPSSRFQFLSSPNVRVESRGMAPFNKTDHPATANLKATIRLFGMIELNSQQDFEEALTDHGGFCTYPQFVDAGIAASWDGCLALAPAPPDPGCGSGLVGHWPLNPYDALHASRPTSGVLPGTDPVVESNSPPFGGWLTGFEWLGSWTDFRFSTATRPLPGDPSGGLFSTGPQGGDDLIPGGGLRYNLWSRYFDAINGHHPAPERSFHDRTMYLPLGPAQMGANSLDDGVISMWVKFNHQDRIARPVLFSWNFLVRDPQLEAMHGPEAAFFNGTLELSTSLFGGEGNLFPRSNNPVGYGGPAQGVAQTDSISKLYARLSLTHRKLDSSSSLPSQPTFSLNSGLAAQPSFSPARLYNFTRLFAIDVPVTPSGDASDPDDCAPRGQFQYGHWNHIAVCWQGFEDLTSVSNGVVSIYHNGRCSSTLMSDSIAYRYDGQAVSLNQESDGNGDSIISEILPFETSPSEVVSSMATSIEKESFIPQSDKIMNLLKLGVNIGYSSYDMASGPGVPEIIPYPGQSHTGSIMDVRVYDRPAAGMTSGPWFQTSVPGSPASPLPLSASCRLDLGRFSGQSEPFDVIDGYWVVQVPIPNVMDLSDGDDCAVVLTDDSTGDTLFRHSRSAAPAESRLSQPLHADPDSWSVTVAVPPDPQRNLMTASPLVGAIRFLIRPADSGKVLHFRWN